MSDILIRIEGRAGRITLNRPEALNALTWEMCLKIEAALDDWRDDDSVALVIIDAAGDKAFCAGGDIQEMYRTGKAGDFDYGRRFWADEYRLNAKISSYPKPYIAFMQGFTMGGGVGVSCHGSHRIVGTGSRIAMPECGIGLVPDVGGSLLLARAPGRVGAYLGLTGARMGPADAILAGFADQFVSESRWPRLIEQLCDCGDAFLVGVFASSELPPPPGRLAGARAEIDALFAGADPAAIAKALEGADSELAEDARKAMARNSPLSMAVTLEILNRLGPTSTIAEALGLEYRYTWRAMESGDFIEGIRAAIIDKDRQPRWRHGAINDVSGEEVAAMLAPLGENALDLHEETVR